MSTHRLAAVAETWVHLLVVHCFRTSGLDFDPDAAAHPRRSAMLDGGRAEAAA